MSTVQEDYTKPLNEVYESLPESTRATLNEDIRKIWQYFIAWIIYTLFSFLLVYLIVSYAPIHEEIGEKLQRAGSIIPILAILGESLFIVKFHKLSSVTHWAKLTCEIYKERRFKPLIYISLSITFLIVVSGEILSGYGDLFF